MKAFNSWIFKICLIFSFLISTPFCFAGDIPIAKDGNNPPPKIQPLEITSVIPVEATINDLELAIYFDSSIGDVTVSVVDALNFTVYQETVDTNSTSEIHIPVDAWTSGEYSLKFTYGSTALQGDFVIQ